MPDDTGHHEVVANVLHGLVVVGSGGDAAAGTLEDEGEKVAQDEDPGVVARLEAGEVGADLDDDVLESGRGC